MTEPSEIKIGPEFLAIWNETYSPTNKCWPSWYEQEDPQDIEERRRGVERMNEYALRLIREGEEADNRWRFWAGFSSGIIATATLFGLVWSVLVWLR